MLCSNCDGTGYSWDGQPCHCSIGQDMLERSLSASDAYVAAYQALLEGWLRCPRCQGSGNVGYERYLMCPECRGLGRR